MRNSAALTSAGSFEPAAEEPCFGRGVFDRLALGIPDPTRHRLGTLERWHRRGLLAHLGQAFLQSVQLLQLSRETRRSGTAGQPLGQVPGPSDLLSRPIQQRLAHRLKQPVSLQRPGRLLRSQRPRVGRPGFSRRQGQVSRRRRLHPHRDAQQQHDTSRNPHCSVHRIHLLTYLCQPLADRRSDVFSNLRRADGSCKSSPRPPLFEDIRVPQILGILLSQTGAGRLLIRVAKLCFPARPLANSKEHLIATFDFRRLRCTFIAQDRGLLDACGIMPDAGGRARSVKCSRNNPPRLDLHPRQTSPVCDRPPRWLHTSRLGRQRPSRRR